MNMSDLAGAEFGESFVSNTHDGYVVMIHVVDRNDYRKCFPIQNFGDNQSDAKEFAKAVQDRQLITEMRLKGMICRYDKEEKYKLSYRRSGQIDLLKIKSFEL